MSENGQPTEEMPGEAAKDFFRRVAERHEAAMRLKNGLPKAQENLTIRSDATDYLAWREPGDD